MPSELVARLLAAKYGHHLQWLPNGDHYCKLTGVRGGDVVRVAATFEESVGAALDAADAQEAQHAS